MYLLGIREHNVQCPVMLTSSCVSIYRLFFFIYLPIFIAVQLALLSMNEAIVAAINYAHPSLHNDI